MSLSNFYWAQDSIKWFIPRKAYWILFAAIRDIYTTVLVVCMLDMGRKFYEKYRWNTTLFKITIIELIIFDCVNIADIVLIFWQQRNLSYFPLFIAQLLLGVITTTCSFLYAFLPVIALHLNNTKHPSSMTKLRNNISAQSAAVGTWYMSVTGVLSISYLTLYLITFVFTEELNYNPIGNAFDSILRTCISLSIALPPPSKLIHIMKLKIVGRMSTYVTPKDLEDNRKAAANGGVERN
ncbi:6105_t:CDS:2 [Funneliformis caledonium]|uniref:6105_t:CDS:1 n=1 Tax=Funneliformis caledonium TaxID=1117310 RepID=A0A9N9B052_9GLOM|nr:6105_t:CDS:2 [Funneliformis caledonium]